MLCVRRRVTSRFSAKPSRRLSECGPLVIPRDKPGLILREIERVLLIALERYGSLSDGIGSSQQAPVIVTTAGLHTVSVKTHCHRKNKGEYAPSLLRNGLA